MPEAEEKKTVDIDTSGPEVEIKLPEEKQREEDNTYESNENNNIAVDTSKESNEQLPVRDEKNEGGEVTQKADKVEGDPQQANSKAVEEYSEGVKKRIAKLTKKMREAERQKEEALRYADSVKRERDKFKTQATSLDKDYTTEMESRIASSLSAAQAKLAAARESQDSKAEVEALTTISQLGYEQGKLAELKSAQAVEEKSADQKPTLQPRPQAKPTPDPKAEQWAEKNDWFGTDNAMTYTAFDLHRKLTEEEGMDPKSDDYYAEIDKRMRLDFPHKFGRNDSQESTKPTQTVASATRSVKPGRNTVRLTSSQVAIAKKLGVPLEEYAKQLKITKEA